MSRVPSASSRAGIVFRSPFATVSHIYLLVAGVLIGLALGPAILGRLAPSVYDTIFVGGGEDALRLAREEAGLQQQVRILREAGATEVAEREMLLRESQRLAPLKLQVEATQTDTRQKVHGWLMGLVAAVVVLAVVEALVAPDVPPAGSLGDPPGSRAEVSPAVGGLVTARYGLMAMWVALLVAKPSLLLELPWVLAAGLALVAAGAALVPLGRSR